MRARFDAFSDSHPECLKWQFDRRYVLAYGLLFSAVLALAFAPVFFVMRRAGDGLRDDTYALPDPSDETFFDVVERRRAFDALACRRTCQMVVVFKAGAAILTPLAASLVSTFVRRESARQREPERAAAARGALDPDPAAVGLDDPAADREADPRALAALAVAR